MNLSLKIVKYAILYLKVILIYVKVSRSGKELISWVTLVTFYLTTGHFTIVMALFKV